MARPTKYGQEIVTKAQHYLDNHGEYGHKIPSSAGLALVLGLSRETLRLWSKDEDKKEFLVILDRINQKQECVLLENGLDGTFNSTITKLVLGKHGYHDRPQQGDTQVQVIINGVALSSSLEMIRLPLKIPVLINYPLLVMNVRDRQRVAVPRTQKTPLMRGYWLATIGQLSPFEQKM